MRVWASSSASRILSIIVFTVPANSLSLQRGYYQGAGLILQDILQMPVPHLYPVASWKSLHIMPIGDSITEGFRSSDGNGYRLPLLRLLQSQGADEDANDNEAENNNDDHRVRFLGSLHSGNMTNNAHEGYGGATIRSIAAAVRESLRERSPDVMLVHAGTNDLNMQEPAEPYETAPRRLGEMLDQLLCAQPDAVVVVARIVQSSFPGTRERIEAFNALVPAVVMERLERGCRVLVADMSSVGEAGKSLADGLHPDDEGYEKMAHVWFSALKEAGSRGWIKSADGLPENIQGDPTCLCRKGQAQTP